MYVNYVTFLKSSRLICGNNFVIRRNYIFDYFHLLCNDHFSSISVDALVTNNSEIIDLYRTLFGNSNLFFVQAPKTLLQCSIC